MPDQVDIEAFKTGVREGREGGNKVVCFSVASVDALIRELEQLRAIVAKLPLTRDGVRVVPHITEAVYHPRHGECWIANGVAASYYPPERPKGPASMVLISQCYSTPEAAEAAAKKGVGDG